MATTKTVADYTRKVKAYRDAARRSFTVIARTTSDEYFSVFDEAVNESLVYMIDGIEEAVQAGATKEQLAHLWGLYEEAQRYAK